MKKAKPRGFTHADTFTEIWHKSEDLPAKCLVCTFIRLPWIDAEPMIGKNGRLDCVF